MTLANFEDRGVDTTHVHTVDGSSGVAPIWVEPDGTNRIIIVPGANHRLTSAQAVEAIAAVRPDVVLGQFEIPQNVTAAAFDAGHRGGAITILNPAPAAAIDDDLLALSDWVVPNEVEFAILFGSKPTDDALREAAGSIPGRLLVTIGAAGSALVDLPKIQRLPAPAVAAMDTTGAGDAFLGAFAYGLGAGLDEALTVQLANVCAADSVTRPGTQSSFPSSEAASAFLAEIAG
jgi:ribokinase